MANLAFLIFVLVQRAYCAFFDPTDVEDPLSLFWYTAKDFSFNQNNSPCITRMPGTDLVLNGQCRHKTLCLLSGGQIHTNGDCGNFLTCCTRPSLCSKRTKSKVSYFISDLSDFTNSVTECEYTVERMHDNICQMRLDFEEFQLRPSKPLLVEDGKITSKCEGEYMTVTPNTYNIPTFCGFNNGQHVYVHLYSHREVKLNVHLINRISTQIQGDSSLQFPKWKIKITQLACPKSGNFFTKHINFDFDDDYKRLAPEGATQYFIEDSGRIRSFGFDGQTGEYISGLRYSIAFKTGPSKNCIWFTSKYALLRNTGDPNDNNTINYCSDYLFVPNFQEIKGPIDRYGSHFCPTPASPNEELIFALNTPPPFYIYFRSGPTFDVNDMIDHAFDIQYELTSCNLINNSIK